MKRVYLDYAAATPMSDECEKAMRPFFSDQFYNPSATYLSAKQVKKSLENCRHKIASTVGARASEVVFTAGGTEANNLAIQGVMNHYPGSNIVISAIEHDSVIIPSKNYKMQIATVNENGRVGIDQLEKMIDDQTVLVSIGYVNHELGTIQDIGAIANLLRIIRDKRAQNGNNLPIYLHTDAAQAACYLDLHVSRLGIDLMSVNGGKIYGPKQSGFLYIRTGTNLTPSILGGGQEHGLRSGTENVAAIHGLTVALIQAQHDRKQETERIESIKELFAKKSQKLFSKIIINTPAKFSAPHILNITIPGIDNERVMMELDEMGIMVALGSACSASSEEPSRVLKAIGLPDIDARASLRISFGRQTMLEDANLALQKLAAVVKS